MTLSTEPMNINNIFVSPSGLSELRERLILHREQQWLICIFLIRLQEQRKTVIILSKITYPWRAFGPDTTRTQRRHHCANPPPDIILPSTPRSRKLSFLEVLLLIFCIHFPPPPPHKCCMSLVLKRG
jgi:hypothetical protein